MRLAAALGAVATTAATIMLAVPGRADVPVTTPEKGPTMLSAAYGMLAMLSAAYGMLAMLPVMFDVARYVLVFR